MKGCVYGKLKRFLVLILVILFLVVILIGIGSVKVSKVSGVIKKSFMEFNFENKLVILFKVLGKFMVLKIDSIMVVEGSFLFFVSGRK